MNEEEDRFVIELEFVQSLANPYYINYLAQRDYFAQPAFLNYLKYLQYWKLPDYVKFIKWPQALFYLDLLQYHEFREAMKENSKALFCEEQQLMQWLTFVHKKRRLERVAESTDEATV